MGKYKFTVVDQQVPLNDSNGNSGLLSRSLSMYEVSTAKTLKGVYIIYTFTLIHAIFVYFR